MENRWFEAVDIYCERLSSGFWAEPVNSVTNIFFLLTSFMAFRLWQKSASRSWDMLALAILIGIVGVGSFIFHTVATKWASLADVIPIAIYIHFGLALFLYRIMKFDLMFTMLGTFFYFIFGVGLQRIVPPDFFNRSGQYSGAILLLLLMAAFAYIRKVPSARYFLMGFIIFGISLIFRSMDMPMCAEFPLGLHFMWHLLNAVVMYVVYKGIMSYSRLSVKV